MKSAFFSKSLAAVFVLLLAFPAHSFAQNYQPAPENLAARKWFQDAKFGLFIHWGVYAVPGGEWKNNTTKSVGEWIMNTEKIQVLEYEKIAAQFNPTEIGRAHV